MRALYPGTLGEGGRGGGGLEGDGVDVPLSSNSDNSLPCTFTFVSDHRRVHPVCSRRSVARHQDVRPDPYHRAQSGNPPQGCLL